MGERKAFPLRIEERLLKAVEKWASDEFRSTNGQLEWMIYQALINAKRLPEQKSEPDGSTQKQGS